MKIPKRLNILGHEWRIMFVSESKIKGAVGRCHYPQREIHLLDSIRGQYLWLTFLHELWHARQFEAGWTQVLGAQAMELDCEGFASFITSVFNLSFKKPRKKNRSR